MIVKINKVIFLKQWEQCLAQRLEVFIIIIFSIVYYTNIMVLHWGQF